MRQYALPSRLSRYTNPRFLVTNVHDAFGSPRFLYETVYCQRGEMENRLKECRPCGAWLRHDAICSQTARQHPRRIEDAPPARCERTSCGSGCRHSLTSSCAQCDASG